MPTPLVDVVARTIEHRGHTVPTFLYGTAWKEERTEGLTRQAIEAGFIGIDTANQRKHYFEVGVAKAVLGAINDGITTREDLFLQTKFTYARSQDHRLPYDPRAAPAEQVRQSAASSLQHFETDYIDAFLLHGPSARDGLVDQDYEVWRTMEALHNEGALRHLGISNVSAHQLRLLIEAAEVKPAYVQNRCYASRGWDNEVRGICRDNDILYQGFSLLTANVDALKSAPVVALARRRQRSIAQIVFRACLQLGMMPLTGTSNLRHMADDLAVYDAFELDADEVNVIESAVVRV